MFHKKSLADFIKRNAWYGSFLVWMLGSVAISIAQEPTEIHGQEGYGTHDVLQTGREQEEMRTTDADQSVAQEPIPIPISDEAAKSLGGQYFVDDVFRSTRNNWGFTIGAYYGYSSDIATGDLPRRESRIASIIPRVFLNLGKRRSKLHLDAGAGYRHYSADNELNSWDYYGNAQYSYTFSKRTSFQIYDQFTSSYNDSWPFLSLSYPLSYDPSYSNEVIFNRQRITRNSLRAKLDHRIADRVRMGVFGGYNLYRYPQSNLDRADAFDIGGELDFRITDWLYLSNHYSYYLNDVDDRFSNARIHRLQVGGLDFRITNSWRIWGGGGIEVADHEGSNYVRESINAGLGYTSLDSMFNLTYQRGFTSAIGLSTLLSSDIISAYYGYRINRRMRANIQSYYYRNTEQTGGLLKTFSGGGGLEFDLSRNFVATVAGYYQNQDTRNFSIQWLDIDRITAYAGLQFVWPARRRSAD